MAPSTVLSQSGGCMAGSSSAQRRAKRAGRVGRWAWLACLVLAALLACRERVGASLPESEIGAPGSGQRGGERAAIFGTEGGAGSDSSALQDGGAPGEGGAPVQARPEPAPGSPRPPVIRSPGRVAQSEWQVSGVSAKGVRVPGALPEPLTTPDDGVYGYAREVDSAW